MTVPVSDYDFASIIGTVNRPASLQPGSPADRLYGTACVRAVKAARAFRRKTEMAHPDYDRNALAYDMVRVAVSFRDRFLRRASRLVSTTT